MVHQKNKRERKKLWSVDILSKNKLNAALSSILFHF